MKRSQLVLIAAAIVVLAFASTAWWASSPRSMRKTGEAMVILMTAVTTITYRRRLPPPSPAVLCWTLVGLGVVTATRRFGSAYAIAVTVFAGLAWTGMAVTKVLGPWFFVPRPSRGPRGPLS